MFNDFIWIIWEQEIVKKVARVVSLGQMILEVLEELMRVLQEELLIRLIVKFNLIKNKEQVQDRRGAL